MTGRHLIIGGGFLFAAGIYLTLEFAGGLTSPPAAGAGGDEAIVAAAPLERKTPPSSARRAPRPDQPVQASTQVVDFGRVLVGHPGRQYLVLRNYGGAELRLEGLRLREPFRAEREELTLKPGAAAELPLLFDAAEPGRYEQKLELPLGGEGGRSLIVMVRGEAVLTPELAGVPLPPPPDLIVRQYLEQEQARAIAEMEAWLAGRTQGEPGAEGAAAGDDPAEASGDSEEGTGAPPAGRNGPPGTSLPLVIAAFGESLEQDRRANEVPVPLPEGETVPDLPPAGGGSGDDGDDEEGDPEEESGARAREKEPVGLFTLAPNSSLLVYSSVERFGEQAFPLRVLANGRVFELHGRIRFPDVVMAFGQAVSIEQWGNIAGTVSSDGTVRMSMVLRIHDPNRNVLDLPMTLTTGRVLGYSAEGRPILHAGIPWDRGTKFVKLVGIANIPLGQGSSLDKAPVILDILGTLEL